MMYQLKNSSFITHNVISFYFRRSGGSLIKFGSYDKAGLKDPAQFYVFKTDSANDWAVTFSKMLLKHKNDKYDLSI